MTAPWTPLPRHDPWPLRSRHIPRGRELALEEHACMVGVILRWSQREMAGPPGGEQTRACRYLVSVRPGRPSAGAPALDWLRVAWRPAAVSLAAAA